MIEIDADIPLGEAIRPSALAQARVYQTDLRTILLAWRRSRDDGFELTVIPGSEQVWRTLRLTGLDAVLPIANK